MPRDNFNQPTKTEISLRAAHFCSNRRCLRLTAGPPSSVLRGLATGHAAHICAVSPGGPRFDADQSEAERRSAANGLWLCRECGDVVDKDDSGYSADELRAWKHDHEAMIAEVRQRGWSRSIVLLRSGQNSPGLAREIVALMEDRRAFWARCGVTAATPTGSHSSRLQGPCASQLGSRSKRSPIPTAFRCREFAAYLPQDAN